MSDFVKSETYLALFPRDSLKWSISNKVINVCRTSRWQNDGADGEEPAKHGEREKAWLVLKLEANGKRVGDEEIALIGTCRDANKVAAQTDAHMDSWM